MDDNERMAHRVIECLGGISQVSGLQSEPTRLHLQVRQLDDVDWDKLRHVRGVVRVIDESDGVTLVMGPGIASKVSEAIRAMDGLDESLRKKGLFGWLRG